MKFIIILTTVYTLLTGCAFAPFHNTRSAATLGEGNWSIDTGLSPGLYIHAERGISKNLDLGIGHEALLGNTISLSSKYSLLNNQEDFSFAVIGALITGDAEGFYLGSIVSYKKKWFETFFSIRYNYVKPDNIEIKDNDDYIFDTLISEGTTTKYIQYTLGFNFWFSQKFGMSIDAKSFIPMGSLDLSEEASAILPGLSFIWKI